MKSKVNKMRITIIAVIAIVLTLWFAGIIGVLTKGMAYIANNTKEFNDANGHVIDGEYSVSIDLSDLQSNIGKELYNIGSHKIYVSSVDNTGSSRSGGYRISFRSCGQYTLTSATLISGIRHKTEGENSFSSDMSAKMTAEYNGKLYESGVFGMSGLNYKDGDDFAFYIFPSESYKNGEISLSEKGTVYLTVTNLYKNVWSKK